MKSKAYIAKTLGRFMTPVWPMDSSVIDALAEVAVCEPVSKKDRICLENEPFNKVVWISDGIFRLSRVMSDEDQTIAFGVEGDPFLSTSTYLYGEPSLFSYNPVTDGEIISVANDDFKKLINSTELVMWLNRVLLRQVHALENRYVWLGQSDVYSRYLRLIKLRPNLVKQVPLKYIASYLGVTQSTLSRIRARIAGK